MIKIRTGFRDDQYYIIPNTEAHKAYYLFNNPEARTVFSNGVALVGKNIQGIEPDWNGSMGWNPTHKLNDDDWNEIKGKGLDKKFSKLIESAKKVAELARENQQLLQEPLSEIKLLA